LGTVFVATTPGTEGSEAGDEPPLRLRGDELDLYAEFHSELVRTVQSAVRASREIVDDACAFAWVEFFRYQPDRHEGNWRGWLFTTAQREAWRQTALEWKERPVADSDGVPVEPADPHDRYEQRLEFQAALQELRKLPPQMREVVLLRSQTSRQRDVAEVMGISRQRVAHLLVEAAMRVAALNEQRHDLERPVASPRAARLRELEEAPPDWLRNSIGVCPRRTKSDSGTILAWRRSTLAIDDYRITHGYYSRTDAIGDPPSDPVARRAYQRAERAIASVEEERARRKYGQARER
jgi:DNA-directed RNA polymerase specialized sigma24 family protein